MNLTSIGVPIGSGPGTYVHEHNVSTNGVTTSLGLRRPDMGSSVTRRVARAVRFILGTSGVFLFLVEQRTEVVGYVSTPPELDLAGARCKLVDQLR